MSFLASSRMVITENPSPAAQLHASAFMNTDPTTSVQNLQRPLYRKDIFYSGSVMNISPVKSHLSLKSYIASVASIPQQVNIVVSGVTIWKIWNDTIHDMRYYVTTIFN